MVYPIMLRALQIIACRSWLAKNISHLKVLLVYYLVIVLLICTSDEQIFKCFGTKRWLATQASVS